MSDLFLRPLFTWRSAVASEFGPPSPTTRHVLLTLSLHMSERGDSCFPSLETLAVESGLTLRAVKSHMATAVDDGWIGKRERRMANTRGWRRMEYFAQIPPEVEKQFHVKQAGESDAPPKGGEHGAPAAQEIGDGGAPGSEGGAPGGKNVVHDVHPSTTRSTPKRKKAAAPLVTESDFPLSQDLLDWGKEKGFELYMKAHYEHFLDYLNGSEEARKRYTDLAAAFRNCVRSDWGNIRQNMVRQGVKPQKDINTACQRQRPGTNEQCGMPGKPHPIYKFSCEHCNLKEKEVLQHREIPPAAREALSHFKRPKVSA